MNISPSFLLVVSFDPELVDFQWEMLGKILSDEQARTLLHEAA